MLALTAAAPPAFPYRANVEVARTEVALGDLVDLSRLPVRLQRPAKELVVAEFRPRQTQMMLPASAVAARARTLMPALGPWLGAQSEQIISVERPQPSPAQPAQDLTALTCLRVVQAVAAGDLPTSSDLAAAPCTPAAEAAPVRYRADLGVLQMTRGLKAGEVIRGFSGVALPTVIAGQALTITTQVGPVQIQRRVTALQPAAPGQALFVRTREGAVLAAGLPENDDE